MDRRRYANDPGPLAHSSYLRRALAWIALSLLVGQSVILLFFLAPGTTVQFIVLSAGILIVLAALLLNHRGRTETAGSLIAISLTGVVTMLGTAGAGIRDIGIIAYPAILIIASLILRRNTSLLLTVFILACLAWLVFGEIYGWYQPLTSVSTQTRHFLITAIVIILTAFAVQTISLTVRHNTIALNRELDERRRVEKALRETEDLFRNMVERTSVITYRDTAEEQSETIYISPQIRDILGYSQDEWRDDPKLWLKVTHPDDAPGVISMIKECLTQGKSVGEYRMVSKGGKWHWFQDEAVLVRDEEGNPQYIHGVLIDITERKIAEQKVSQREAILSAVANTTQKLLKAPNWRDEIDAILKLLGEATGASHVYLFENYKGADGVLFSSQKYEWTAPGMKSELDNPIYQNTKVIPSTPGLEDWYAKLSKGLPFYGSGRQYPDYWKKVFEPRGLKTLLDVPIYVNEEWWGTIGFDDYVHEMPWSQVEIDALVAAAGNLGTAIERQQADLALRISEEKFHLAFHHTHVAMAINKVSDNTLVDVNNAFCKITGYSREEAVGKRAGRDLKIWADPQDRDNIFRTLEEQGYVDEYRGRFRRKNGEVGIGLLSVINISIAGEPCQLYTFYDISRIDQLLNELREKNEELQSFTYTVSHDLKAPLVTISGFMGYLEQDARKGDVERLNKDIQRINEAVVKMQRLINELLELSRIGRLMNPPEEVSFGEIVREALELVDGPLKARQVRVEVEADLPSVCGDRARLVEVVQNLVDNSVKFMGDQAHPLVEIGMDRSRERTFFVRDNGIGIEPEQQERVFGLFNKLDAQTEGTGIGLALVKRIIEVHGGKIWVESEGTGKGSTFYFTLTDCFNGGAKHDG